MTIRAFKGTKIREYAKPINTIPGAYTCQTGNIPIKPTQQLAVKRPTTITFLGPILSASHPPKNCPKRDNPLCRAITIPAWVKGRPRTSCINMLFNGQSKELPKELIKAPIIRILTVLGILFAAKVKTTLLQLRKKGLWPEPVALILRLP
jgi:hypothetical protein